MIIDCVRKETNEEIEVYVSDFSSYEDFLNKYPPDKYVHSYRDYEHYESGIVNENLFKFSNLSKGEQDYIVAYALAKDEYIQDLDIKNVLEQLVYGCFENEREFFKDFLDVPKSSIEFILDNLNYEKALKALEDDYIFYKDDHLFYKKDDFFVFKRD